MPYYRTQHIHAGSNASPLKTMKDIMALHEKGIITDEEFATLVRVIGTEHIETEVCTRVGERLERTVFDRIFDAVVGRGSLSAP